MHFLIYVTHTGYDSLFQKRKANLQRLLSICNLCNKTKYKRTNTVMESLVYFWAQMDQNDLNLVSRNCIIV